MENKWITYDDEEAEVELEIADLVFDKMVTEAAELIAQIHERRRTNAPDLINEMNPGSSSGMRRTNNRLQFSDITKIDTDLNFNSV